MKKVAIILMCMFSLSVMAEEKKMYGGVQYAMISYSEPGIDVDPSALVFRIGQRVNKNFAFEGRFGIGMGDDSTVFLGFPVTIELDQFFSIFAKGIAPVAKNVDVYALIGYTDGEITGTITGLGSISVSESDMSLGFGIDIGAGKDMSWNIEFVNYIDKNNATIDAFSIGANFAF